MQGAWTLRPASWHGWLRGASRAGDMLAFIGRYAKANARPPRRRAININSRLPSYLLGAFSVKGARRPKGGSHRQWRGRGHCHLSWRGLGMNVWICVMCAEFLFCMNMGGRCFVNALCVCARGAQHVWLGCSFQLCRVGLRTRVWRGACVAVCVGRPWWWHTITNHDEGGG